MAHLKAESAGHRIPAAVLWGALIVIIWAALTVLLGGGQARAAEENPQPLSGLTTLVNNAVSGVVDPAVESASDAVTEATSPVMTVTTKVVASTARTIEQTPIVGKPAADALGAAAQSVSIATDTVTEVISDAPVSSIVRPVTAVVRDVPAVGAVLDDLGATDLLDTSAGAVDGLVDSLTPVLDATLPPVVDSLAPQSPDDGSGVPDGEAQPSATTEDVRVSALTAVFDTSCVATVRTSAWWPAVPTTSVAAASGSQASDADGPSGTAPVPPPGVAPAGSSAGLAGSAGALSAALHQLGVHADSAWTATGLPVDCALPPSPAGSTDVSPD